MGSPLDKTFGFWLITIWLQTLLQGCGLLQAWLYFHWYSTDHWGIKSMVYSLVAIETFQIVVWFHATYAYLIDGFGNPSSLLVIRWEDSAQLIATYFSAFIVQMYFGYCIYALNRANKIIPGIIATLALVQIGSGLAQTILTVKISVFSDLGSTKPVNTIEAASALLCDVMITASLIYNLGRHKGHVKSTDSLLNNLMINAVNRGMLTATCSALNLILFIALPGTFYFFIGLELSGKLYMNSALATLNSRQHILEKSRSGTLNLNSIHLDTLPTSIDRDRSNTRSMTEDGHVRVIVSKQSEIHEDIKQTSTFMDGMI